MPWKVRQRNCRQKSTDKTGSHAVVKVDGESEEQETCHASKEKADAAIRARYANENLLREFIRLRLLLVIH